MQYNNRNNAPIMGTVGNVLSQVVVVLVVVVSVVVLHDVGVVAAV